MRKVFLLYIALFAIGAFGMNALTHTENPLAPQARALSAYLEIMASVGERKSPCAGDSAEDYWCWEKHYESLAKRNPQRALKDLKAEYTIGSYPGRECHAFLHVIGEEAAHRYKTISEAYARGDPFCQSGYYHGVLIGFFSEPNAEELLTRLDSICSDVVGKDRYSREYFLCVHGIGHGTMAFFGHDIFRSLSACEMLSGAWEQGACSGGVFMENVMASGEDKAFLKDDNLNYPCDAVFSEHQYHCYLFHAPYVWERLEGNTEKFFEFCDALEERNRPACYQGLGGSVIDEEYTAAHVREQCLLGGSSEKNLQCILGAAHEFLVYYHSLARAQDLCDVTGEYEAYCLQSIQTYYWDF